MKKLLFGFIALTLSAILVINGGIVNVYSKNINENDRKIKVFVGSIDTETTNGKAVKADRINYIQKMAKEAGEKKVSGVLAYNDYYSIDAIYDMLRKYQNSITIEEVWFSIPGESGKNMSKVKSNDIKSAISNFIQAMQTDYYNIEDFAAKKEQYRIFALTFTSKYHFVDNMLKDDMIELIDIFDYPEVEKEALDKQKRISYIAFPQKPEKEVGE